MLVAAAIAAAYRPHEVPPFVWWAECTAGPAPKEAGLTPIPREWLRLSPYLPIHPTKGAWTPTPPQGAFLLLDCQEALYGGATGGGKSDALLVAALQFADVPGYAALILRRTYPDLALPGAIMDRAKEWLAPHLGAGAVRWTDKDKTFFFPSGASLTFGYLATERDKLRYQGAEFQFIGVDEATQFPEGSVRYLFSRLRKPQGMPVPLRFRLATNPGGPGHEWVKLRYNLGLDPDTGRRGVPPAGRVFIPALLTDNPHLDIPAYLASLEALDPITRAQLVAGDWGARPAGEMFRRAWFTEGLVDVAPAGCRWVRRWDLAATRKRSPGHDPDFTAGALLGFDPATELVYVADVVRDQDTPGAIERLVRATAETDRLRHGHVAVRMEQEPGSAGLAVVEAYTRALRGFDYRGVLSSGAKSDRAAPFSRYAERGLVRAVRGPWVPDWIAELEAFPQDAVHDDQVDATSGAFSDLAAIVPVAGGAAPPPPSRALVSRSLADNPYHAPRPGTAAAGLIMGRGPTRHRPRAQGRRSHRRRRSGTEAVVRIGAGPGAVPYFRAMVDRRMPT